MNRVATRVLLGVTALCLSHGPATAGDLQITFAGSCPGEETVTVTSASPGGAVDIYRGTQEGAGAVPAGPCAGLELSTVDPLLLVSVIADGGGSFAITTTMSAAACGGLFQVVDVASCTAGNVARLTSGYPAPAAVSGQTTSFSPGDDGDLGKGVAWPLPRFVDRGDGTVVDQLTGLVWLRNANCFGTIGWTAALTSASDLADGACGLTDGSVAGDWHLPQVRELHSLIDYGENDPALPAGHPFTGVISSGYWTATPLFDGPAEVWGVRLGTGEIGQSDDPTGNYVWPVRGEI